MTKYYFAYILTNKRHTVLYIGVTNDLNKRTLQHKLKQSKGSTNKYNVNKLIYFETFQDIKLAIKREKQLKNLLRRKKEVLINKENPKWEDLFEKFN